MSEQPKTVGGLEPVICENADGTCWISGGNFRELCSDGTWVGLDKSGSVWPTREVAQRFIDRHADQPPSGKDSVQDDKKPCLCNGICLGKEQLHSNRVCQFDLAFPAVPQEAAPPPAEVERVRAEIRKWIDNGCTPPPSPQELAWYACTTCNARCVKLWREPHGGKVLKCATCLSPDKPVDERGQQTTEHGQTTDQVDGWLPAVPIGDTFYGYSSVPPQCVGWWKGLPTYETAEHHLRNLLARIHRDGGHYAEEHGLAKASEDAEAIAIATLQRAEEAERQRDADAQAANAWRALMGSIEALCELPKTHTPDAKMNAYIEAWQHQKQRAETAEAVLSVLRAENYELRMISDVATTQLAAANSRLAKVRDSLTRLAKWVEPSPFAEAILAEAQAELAEEQP